MSIRTEVGGRNATNLTMDSPACRYSMRGAATAALQAELAAGVKTQFADWGPVSSLCELSASRGACEDVSAAIAPAESFDRVVHRGVRADASGVVHTSAGDRDRHIRPLHNWTPCVNAGISLPRACKAFEWKNEAITMVRAGVLLPMT